MSVFRTNSFEEIKDFATCDYQLGIVERKIPRGIDEFFQKLMQRPLGIAGKVRKENVNSNIKEILEEEISKSMKNKPFFEKWIEDMANAAELFCDIQKSDSVSFWLSSERGCRRYHIDNVPLRMLITYA